MTIASKYIYEEATRIKAIECDFKQEWKPAAIFQHLTEAAGIHAEKLGVGFDFMYAQNLFWVHSRMKIKFLELHRAGDMVLIRTWPKTIHRKLLYIRDFEVLDRNGQLLVAATSAWVIINAITHRMAPPKSVKINLPELSDHTGLDEPLDRLGLAQNGDERLYVRAGYSAVDIVGHVNNSRYIEWICDVFPLEMFTKHRLDWIQINYEHEVLPGEEVSILVNPIEQIVNMWAVEGRNCSNNTRAFESLLHWQD
jgi:medium-chain acyl-[acyl-carrier-protein] hydrolase